MPSPSQGMFGIKLIYPDHLDYPHLANEFARGDLRKTLMNFMDTPYHVSRAANIPVGHRALVFTDQHIVWAIEFTGPIDNGSLLAAHGIKPDWPTIDWCVHRPIRFLARMNVDAGSYRRSMHRHEITARSGVTKRSHGPGHLYISEDEYRRMFDVITWDWMAPEDS